MDLNKEKVALVKLLLEVENEHTILQLKSLLDENYDFYPDLPDHVKEGIERGLKEIEEGKTYSHEEVMKEMKKKHGF